MTGTDHRTAWVWRILSVAGAIALVAVAATAPEAAATASASRAAPQLSIGINDGRTSTLAGKTLDYTITVRNLAATKLIGLLVTQTMPTGLTLTSARSGGVAKHGAVTWKVNLAASGRAVLRTVMKVSATPAGTLRLATVACAKTSASSTPIVCASHSDQLPAGKAAEKHHPAASRSASPSHSHTWWYLVGAAVLLALLAITVLARRRRTTHAG